MGQEVFLSRPDFPHMSHPNFPHTAPTSFWIRQAVLASCAMPLLGRAWHLPDSVALPVMIFGGSAAFLAQMLLTVGLSMERVGPASAMRSVNVLAAFVLQRVVTPNEPVQPLSVLGALIISGSVVAILLGRVRKS